MVLSIWLGARFLHRSWPHLWNRPWQDTRHTVARLARQAPANAIWLASWEDRLALRYLLPLRFIEERSTFVVWPRQWQADSFIRLLAILLEKGLRPVLLVGEEHHQSVQVGRAIFEPFGVKTIDIVEPTLESRYHRLPDARDFRPWRHRLTVYGVE